MNDSPESKAPARSMGLSMDRIAGWVKRWVDSLFLRKTGRQKFTGTLTAITPSASQSAIIVQGAASQTATLQEWRDSSGTVLAQVSLNGGHRSGEATIGDDTAITVYTNTFVGLLALWTTTSVPQLAALVHVRAGVSTPHIAILAAGTDVQVSTSDLTGTTGTDGKFTIGATASALKFENRLGASRPVRWLRMS